MFLNSLKVLRALDDFVEELETNPSVELFDFNLLSTFLHPLQLEIEL